MQNQRLNVWLVRTFSVLFLLGGLFAAKQSMGALRIPEYPLTNPPPFNGGVHYQEWDNAIPAANGLITPLPYPGSLGTVPTLTGNILGSQNLLFIDSNPTPPVPFMGKTTNYVVRYDAYFRAPVDGTYQFFTTSDDGSELYIGLGTTDSRDVVQNNFSQPATKSSPAPNGVTDLQQGYHLITVFYGQGGGGYYLRATVATPVAGEAPIDGFLYILPTAGAVVITPGTSNQVGTFPVTLSTGQAATGGFFVYTTDGTTPAAGPQVVNGVGQIVITNGIKNTPTPTGTPFNVTAKVPNVIVQAMQCAYGYENSAIATAVYSEPPANKPTYNPATPTFTGSLSVTISSSSAGVPNPFIYYTTDGSIPTAQNFAGVGPTPVNVTINQNTTFNAIAIAAGYAPSAVATMAYVKTDVAPSIASCLASGANKQVNVRFNVSSLATGLNPGPGLANTASNYTIVDTTGGANSPVLVNSAALDTGTVTLNMTPLASPQGDNVTVRLTLGTALVDGHTYILTVKNLKDNAPTPNTIAAGGITNPFTYFAQGGAYYNLFYNFPGPDYLAIPTAPAAAPVFDFPAPITDPFLSTQLNPAAYFLPILSSFQEPSSTNNINYAARCRAYFICPAAGDYTFGVSANTSAILNIWGDDNPNRPAALSPFVSAATPNAFQSDFLSTPNQLSATVHLTTTGARYFFETRHTFTNGNLDHLEVAFVNPPQTFGDVNQQQAPTASIGAYTAANAVQLTPVCDSLHLKSQPQSRFLVANQSITLSYDLIGDGPCTYVWSIVPANSPPGTLPTPLADGGEISGSTTSQMTINPFTAQDAGTYTVSVQGPIDPAPIVSQPFTLSIYNTLPASTSSINPTFGPTNTATPVTITGNNFVSGMNVTFTLGASTIAATSINVVSPTTLTCLTPKFGRGTATVSVYKPGNSAVSPALTFTFDDQPTATTPAPQTFTEDQTPDPSFILQGSITAGSYSFSFTNQQTIPPSLPTTTLVTAKGTATLSTVAGQPSQARLTYKLKKDQNNATAPVGKDMFNFFVYDGLISSVATPISIDITPVNDPPLITNPMPSGVIQVTEDVPWTINLTGIAPGPVTATDEVNQTVTLSVNSNNNTVFNTQVANNPTNTLKVSPVVNGNATVTFTAANSNSNQPVAITVTADDGQGPPNSKTSVTFNIQITPVNDPPVMDNPGTVTKPGDASGTIGLTGIAPAPPNNPDENGQKVTLSVSSSDPSFFTALTISPPSNGQAQISYTPTFGRNGTVNITVTEDDGQAVNHLSTTTFPLVFTPVHHTPQAVDDFYSVRTNGVFTVPAPGVPGVQANDINYDQAVLKTTLVGPGTSNGALTLNQDGSFTYTPNPNFVGIDTFQYQDDDGTASNNLSNVATVTLNVGPNVAPTASNSSLTTLEDQPKNGQLIASDPNTDPLTYSIVTPPAKGTVSSLNAATGAFTYTPTLYVNGSDSFTFKVNDGQFDSNVATVSITITPVNHAPVALAQTVYVGVNRATTITLVGTDHDNDNLTFALGALTSHGGLVGPVQATPTTATVVYTPTPNYTGPDSFTFDVNDGKVNSAFATVSIVVTPAPVFQSPPTLSPNPTTVGETVTGNATATVVNGSATISWSWGDGNTDIGSPATHVYTTGGSYTVIVTATSPEGVSTTTSLNINVGIGVTGTPPPGTFPPGVNGILFGGGGITAGVKAQLKVDYVNQSKTSFMVVIGSSSKKRSGANGLAYPPGFNLATYVNKPGILTIGSGLPQSQQFIFTLSASGKGKATGLPTITLTPAGGGLAFTVNNRSALTTLIIALGASNTAPGTKTAPQIFDIPCSLQLGDTFFIFVTFQMKYVQSGQTGQGVLDAPNARIR